MNDRTIRLTKELTWQELRKSFFVGNITISTIDEKTGAKKLVSGFVDKQAEAIEDGTMDAMVKACAVEMHDGEVYEVYKAMSRNLSSMKYHLNDKTYSHQKAQEDARYETLRKYVTERMATGKAANVAGNTTGVSYWRWTMTDIKALDITDARTIKSIYDNMGSAKSKYPEKVAEDSTFAARYKLVCEMHATAQKLLKQKTLMTEHTTLVEKLSGGKDVSFTAEEAAELAKLLGKLSK